MLTAELYTEGIPMDQFTLLKEVSVYNHNYYNGYNWDLLFAKSDDDNTTEWYLINGETCAYIGYSLASEGEILHKGLNT